jgi:hypothetical protein
MHTGIFRKLLIGVAAVWCATGAMASPLSPEEQRMVEWIERSHCSKRR